MLRCGNCTGEEILANILPTDTMIEIYSFKGNQIPVFPDTVKSIDLKLSVLLQNFTRVKKRVDPLQSFPAFLGTLLIESAEPEFITSLPPLPPTLQTLWIMDSGLTEVPPLPASLTEIIFSENNITTLPSVWPPNLTYMDFSRNQIREIPSFPPRLTLAFFNNNQIKRIPPIDTITVPEIQLQNNPLVEPFASIYREYRLRMHDGDPDDDDLDQANLFLKTTINNHYAKQEGMQKRQGNLRQATARTLRLKYSGLSNTLGSNLVTDIASLVSGKRGSFNQQLERLYREIPERQPVGITQQPSVPNHIQKQLNAKTRMRLRRLMREEKNIARKTLGGRRKTRRQKKTLRRK